jgi:hypothetical protein
MSSRTLIHTQIEDYQTFIPIDKKKHHTIIRGFLNLIGNVSKYDKIIYVMKLMYLSYYFIIKYYNDDKKSMDKFVKVVVIKIETLYHDLLFNDFQKTILIEYLQLISEFLEKNESNQTDLETIQVEYL